MSLSQFVGYLVGVAIVALFPLACTYLMIWALALTTVLSFWQIWAVCFVATIIFVVVAKWFRRI